MLGIVQTILFLLPVYFLLAVIAKSGLAWVDARRNKTDLHLPTEPIVLMALGCAFLVINEPFVPLVARIASEQLRAIQPDRSFPIVSLAFGVASVVLIASFAKAFWTHLNLEEGEWGPISEYRKKLWSNPFVSAFELLLRVGIAILVVLLQKEIAGLEAIEHIKNAVSWNFTDETQTAAFKIDYKYWLAKTSCTGGMLFTLIGIWLSIATYYNRGNKNLGRAFLGTLLFAGPGLILCWCLNYLATGSKIPSLQLRGDPDFEAVISLCDLMLFSSIVILCNLVGSAWSARNTFIRCYRTIRALEPISGAVQIEHSIPVDHL